MILLEYQVPLYYFTAKQSFIYKQIIAKSSKYSLILMNSINIKHRFPALRLYFKCNRNAVLWDTNDVLFLFNEDSIYLPSV